MKKVCVDEDKCIRCGACMQIAPEVFAYGDDGQSVPKVDMVEDDNSAAIEAMENCPFGAISLENVDGKSTGCDCEDCDCEDCDCGDECECGEDCDCEDCHCNHKE